MFMGLDKPARERAAELIGRYVEGEINGSQLEEGWPQSDRDAALEKIAGELFLRLGSRRLPEQFLPPLRDDVEALLERCRLFLLSDLPYAWGWVGTPGCLTFMLAVAAVVTTAAALASLAGAGWAALLASILILVSPLALLGRVRDARRRIQTLLADDLSCWPFERPEDLAEHAGGSGGGPPEEAGRGGGGAGA